MNQLNKQGEATVAWYKLADLIARREREKALNVYRLLSHSFEDKAYALQLEGDILASLEDSHAHEKYQQAAFLYKKEARWVNAICVCEHLLFLNPYDVELHGLLLDLYAKVGWKDTFQELFSSLCQKYKSAKVDGDKLFHALEGVIQTDRAGEYKEISGWVSSYVKEQLKVMPPVLGERIKRLF